MGLRRRLDKPEQRTEAYRDELRLPDGSILRLGPPNRWNASQALLEEDPEGRRHWLADAILEQDVGEELPPDFVGLIHAIAGDRDGS